MYGLQYAGPLRHLGKSSLPALVALRATFLGTAAAYAFYKTHLLWSDLGYSDSLKESWFRWIAMVSFPERHSGYTREPR